jgi:hypothetical protein
MELDILTKTKAELIGMMPVSQAAQDVAQMPAAVAIKQALDNYNDAKTKKEEILSGMVQELANINMIEELMGVHTG